LIIRIKHFRLNFGSITDRDNQGEVTGTSIIDHDNQASVFSGMSSRRRGQGGSGALKRAPAPLLDAVGSKKKSSTPSTSDRSAHKKSTNVNLAQGKNWCGFSQPGGIGADFRSQVDDGKVKTTLYKVCWSGYYRTGDTWEPITHL
jgi:hypothetical protein